MEGPGPMGLMTLYEETPEGSFSPWAHSEERPCEDFVRRQLPTSQEKKPLVETKTGWNLDLGLSSLSRTMRTLIPVV